MIENRHKDLFFKFWDKYIHYFTFEDFNILLNLINFEVKSEEWFRQFIERHTTKMFFEALPVKEQLDFIERMIKASEYY
jgi:hypothetical protein